MLDRDVGAKLRAELARLTPLNPFEVLKIPAGASAEQVRAAYLTATKAYHPSRFARESAETVDTACELFLVIRRAYSLLSDDAKRKTAQHRATAAAPAPPRIRAGFEAAPPPTSVVAPAAAPAPMPVAPLATRAPATQPPPSAPAPQRTPPTQPPSSTASTRRIPPTQPPRSALTPPPQFSPGSSAVRAPAVQPSRGQSAPATPKPRPPVVPTQAAQPPAAASVAKPVSPQTGRSPEQVSAVLEAMQTRGQRFDKACKHILKNRVEDARSILTQLVTEDAHNRKYRVKLMHAIALEHRDAGRLDDAVRELERAAAFDPEAHDIRAELERLREQRKGIFSKLFGR